jgi:predicted MPP superfamily phosphohydrolase
MHPPPLFLLSFFSAFTLAYLAVQAVLALWLLRHHPGIPVSPGLAAAAALAVAVGFPLSLVLLRKHGGWLCESLAYASMLWAGVSLILLVCVLAGDCAEWAAGMFGARAAVFRLNAWAVPAAGAALCLWAFLEGRRPPSVRRVDVEIPGLPRTLEGFKIAQMSDLHLGLSAAVTRLEEACRIVAGLSPDLVAVTGDFVDPGFRDGPRLEAAGRSLHPPFGVWAVFGNHEFYNGEGESRAWYEAFGARVLRDEAVELSNGLQLAGVDDLMTVRTSPAGLSALLAGLDAGKPSVLLSHQPRMFEVAAGKGVGLMLSGHTHGGQIFPFGWLVRLHTPFVHGVFRRAGSTLIVSSGTGLWGPPLRLGTRSEVVLATLRPAGAGEKK